MAYTVGDGEICDQHTHFGVAFINGVQRVLRETESGEEIGFPWRARTNNRGFDLATKSCAENGAEVKDGSNKGKSQNVVNSHADEALTY